MKTIRVTKKVLTKNLVKSFVGILLISGVLTSCNTSDNKEKMAEYQHTELTDSLITEGIQGELLFHPKIPSNEIEVTTTQGIVTLSGEADNMLIRDEAEEIASAIKGVRGVINHIEVSQRDIPDEQLKDEVVEALRNDPVTDKYEILVEVNDGQVQLVGTVDSWQEMKFAENVVKEVRGVKELDSKMNFNYPETPRPDKELALDIASLLHNDVRIDDALIDVNVENSEVTLSGTVGSVTEKSRAISAAWVAGVEAVNADDLKVEEWARDPRMRQDKYVEKTDDEIQMAVDEVLINDYRVNNFGIDVKVNSGVVTLEGKVDNLKAKQVAEEDAKNVVGVWRVNNELEVQPVKFVNNKALADQVRKTIQVHPYLEQYDIQVNADQGNVELYGVVGSFFDKKEAANLTSKMPGVIEVQNYIEVNSDLPPVVTSEAPVMDTTAVIREMTAEKSDVEIKQDVENQLFWSPFVNEDEINVAVEDGKVILTGSVDTELERESAEKNALQGGAKTIDNKLVVDYSPRMDDPSGS